MRHATPVIRTSQRLACAAAALAAADVLAAPLYDPPDQIPVTGTVRDFKSDHSDFDVTPVGGNGHFASMVGLTSTADQRPAMGGSAFKVATQWRDMDAHNIPPHLFADGDGGVVPVVNAPNITNNPQVDTWDSAAGAYGGSNIGPAPTFVPGSSMPSVSAPSPLPAMITDILYDGNNTSTLSVNRYCKTFTLKNYHKLYISNNIFIYCTETFKIEDNAKLYLNPGAKLTIYIGKNCTIQNNVDVNMNTWDPTRLILINLGTFTIVLENYANFCGTIISPNAAFHVKNNCNFYGTFTGQSVIIQNSAGFHIDGPGAAVICGVTQSDTAGTPGVNSTGGVTSASTFDQWYKDSLGVNLSAQHTIVLTRNTSGIYEYQNNAFFPIDNMLFGNEGSAHNYFFTYTFAVPFVHHECEGRFFEFQGADDAWVFIDGKLGMDLGGVLPGVNQHLPIDRMELIDGQTYTLRLFYAQRNPTSASFNVRTNLDLVLEEGAVVGSASWD